MTVKLGVPPEGDTIRTLVEERLSQAIADNGAKVTLEWRGEQKHLHVISMPVDMLYYNPDTHRVRAQRTLDPERDSVLQEEPWSEPAQDYLCHLLSRRPSNPDQTDPDYNALMDELDDFGQKEPGIITPEGILVDGNTRCAALRELGIKDIRVGVLPLDTSQRDISNVELALQLRRDKRREYSYVNRLIAIDEELSGGRREEDVARDFNIKITTLRRDRWVFGLIQEAIRRSTTDDGSALRLVDFEDHQEKLRELHRDFTTAAKSDPDAAEQLKETRLSMVVLNFPKTSVRLAEADFHTRYLASRLPPGLLPATEAASDVCIPGLPGIKVTDGSPAVKSSRTLTDTLLKARADAQSGKGAKRESNNLLDSARKTFDTAAKLAGQNAQLKKYQAAASERVTDAADYINQCASEFAEARAKRALDEDAFDDALIILKNSLAKLARQAGRSINSPGAGVAWLLEATRER
ncbi:ParB/RepB/Spo0J family partition protein [Streptomyces otsuchiensis]|uniref:ParB/RepB/Spo0J family partition protein n=1 Tax=Streptomyces otsuchiensis TaxID=2681388 RepID=UPI00102FBF2F|nr:ParB/RepB/Spo0J family partition protein [Streptomyces otsuchiensis]